MILEIKSKRNMLFFILFFVFSAGQNSCMEDLVAFSMNCPSNPQISLTDVLVRDAPATCVEGSTILMNITVVLTPNTGGTSFDIGVYVANDGGTSLTGSCSNYALVPVSATNGDLDLTGGSGPFKNEELGEAGDICGDVRTGEGTSVLDIDNVAVKCVNQLDDLRLDLGVCIAWSFTRGTSVNPCTGPDDCRPNAANRCDCRRVQFDEVTIADSCLGPYSRLDFEQDSDSVPLIAGDFGENIYTPLGFTFEALGTSARIFDTANPTCGDPDLGSPNTACPGGGPGIGSGGEPGDPGENCVALDNVLVVQNPGSMCVPNDSPSGTLIMHHTRAVRIDWLAFLDSETTQTINITTYMDAEMTFVNSFFQIQDLGPNSFQNISLAIGNTSCVACTVIQYTDSGALVEVGYRTVCPELCPIFTQPFPQPDEAVTPLDTPICLNVTANDEGRWNPFTLSVVVPPASCGSIQSVTPSTGEICFEPTTSFVGNCTFVYELTNTASGLSGNATVTIVVLPSMSFVPTAQPTETPTSIPTETPTGVPTGMPSASPTRNPTESPTAEPTSMPSASPTEMPSASPTVLPTQVPSASPTEMPSANPTVEPTRIPTAEPTVSPTGEPTAEPTQSPTAATGNLNGHVFYDDNGNGVQDGTEADFAGLLVQVTDSGSNMYSVVTDSAGNYNFTGLLTGSALVNVIDPVGYVETTGVDPQNVLITAFGETFAADVGFNMQACVSGRVYNDLDASGSQNGLEQGFEGLNVTLTDEFGTNYTATTDSEGMWKLFGVPVGNATVFVETSSLPPFVQTEGDNPTFVVVTSNMTDGGTDGLNIITPAPTKTPTAQPSMSPTSRPSASPTEAPTAEPTRMPSAIPTEAPTAEPTKMPSASPTEVPSASPTELPTAEPTRMPTAVPTEAPTQSPTQSPTLETAIVSGHVFIDLNTNGVQDVGEPDAPNSTVVYVKDFNSVMYFAMLDNNGNYNITVPVGPAMINVVDPVGFVETTDTDPQNITVAGPITYANDVGFVQGPCVSGRVYHDENGSFSQDMSEMGLAGVTVTLEDENADFFTTITDMDGNWFFCNVTVGSVTITIDTETIPLPPALVQTEGQNPFMTDVLVMENFTDGGVLGYYSVTASPTSVPTSVPSAIPTSRPSASPTGVPSAEPTVIPTSRPSVSPTEVLSAEPTVVLTSMPSASPTAEPTVTPAPTAEPTFSPVPTVVPEEVIWPIFVFVGVMLFLILVAISCWCCYAPVKSRCRFDYRARSHPFETQNATGSYDLSGDGQYVIQQEPYSLDIDRASKVPTFYAQQNRLLALQVCNDRRRRLFVVDAMGRPRNNGDPIIDGFNIVEVNAPLLYIVDDVGNTRAYLMPYDAAKVRDRQWAQRLRFTRTINF